MRIAHVIDHLGLGGAQTVLRTLLNSWPCPDDAIHVISLGRPADRTDELLQRPNTSVEMLNGSRWSLHAAVRAMKRIRSGDFDVVHAHLTKAVCTTLFARAWLLKQPYPRVILHIHCDPTRDPFLLRAMIARYHRCVNAAIAVSKEIVPLAVRHCRLPVSAVHTVYNSVQIPDPAAQRANPNDRREIGCANDVFLLGFSGRLNTQKGVPFLLEAMKIVCAARDDIDLMLIGDGPLRRSLEDQSRRNGLESHVHFVGFQSPVTPWLTACDAGVLPSLWEGLPMSAIECLALGKPMIATAVNGTPEVVLHEKTGLLVPPRDPNALAEAIVRLADSVESRRHWGQAGRDHVRSLFSAERNARRVREIYSQVLASGASGGRIRLTTS